MSFIKLCGYDVNGFRDVAARNWMLDKDGEAREAEQLNSGGLLSSVVQVGTAPDLRWIGGAQADLAPHGRSEGWGEVGRAERRVSTRDLLFFSTEEAAALAAAFTGLSSCGRINVAAIDEHDHSDEKLQERLLRALQKARMTSPMLVWRSVLAVLYHLSLGDVAPESTVAVLSQSARGLSVQRMRILSSGGTLAPERRRAAHLLESGYGVAELTQKARWTALGEPALNDRNRHRAQARMVGALALGEPVEQEILRIRNGRWEIFEPIDMPLPDVSFGADALGDIASCEFILFESLATGAVADHLRTACEIALNREITHLPPQAVALGALEAARRLQNRQPVYFDFLPQISTIVLTGAEAGNFDLIGSGDVVEAGRLYRSPNPARLALPAGRDSLSVYLKKEAVPEPRKVLVDIGQPLSEQVPVSLLVEQKPAAGRARILLEARDISRQFSVDWDDAEVLEQDWASLIESVGTPAPPYPDRLVLPGGIDAWQTGLGELMERNVEAEEVDWKTLAYKVASLVNRTHCISSEGKLPRGVSLSDEALLNRLTDRAMEETGTRMQGGGVRNNDALRFLTWQFRRCPEELVPILLDCIDEYSADDLSHPFVWHRWNWKLMYQGAARIARDTITEARLLRGILDAPIREGEWFSKTACAAMLLSRSDSAPQCLERADADRLADHAIREMSALVGSPYTTNVYCRFLVAELLRWRAVSPYAFLPDSDPQGDRLVSTIDDVLDDLKQRARHDKKIAAARGRYSATFEELRSAIIGEGSSPDLLLNIYETS